MKKMVVYAVGMFCGALTADTYTWNSTASEGYMNVAANWVEGTFPAITNQTIGRAADIVLGEGDPTNYRRVIMGNDATFKTGLYINSVTGSKNYILETPRVNYSYSMGYWINIFDPSGFYGLWSLYFGPHRGPYRPNIHVTSTDPEKAVIHQVEANGHLGFIVDSGNKVKVEKAVGQGVFHIGVTSSPQLYSGTLDVEQSPGGSSDPLVYSGNIAIHGNPDPDAKTLVPGAWAHFDASVRDSLAISDGNVTAWADISGNGNVATRHTYASYDPTLATDSASGLNVINFGAFGGDITKESTLAEPSAESLAAFGRPAGFVLSEPSHDVREVFIVFQVNSCQQADITPSFLGVDNAQMSSDHVDMLQREKSSTLGTPLFRAPSPNTQILKTCEIRLDGERVQYDHKGNLSESLHVLSLGLDGEKTCVHNIAVGNNTAAWRFLGGIKIAEIVLYTNALTVAQRRRNNAILKRKWLPASAKPDYDYGYLDLRATNSIHVADGTATIREVRVPDSAQKIVKTGAGSVAIGRTYPDALPVEVEEGALWFTADGETVKPERAANPEVWLDATQIDSADTFTENGTNYVRVWRDPRAKNHRGDTITAEPLVYGGKAGNYAALVDNVANGHPFVDLGTFHDVNAQKGYGRDTIYAASNAAPYAVKWNGNQAGTQGNSRRVREGFLVFKIAFPFCQAVFSTTILDNYDFYVGTGRRTTYRAGYCNKYVEGAYWTHNGVPYDAGDVNLEADAVHVVSFAAAEPVPVDAFGIDRGYGTTGGIAIGEWLAYDRQLTPEERRNTIAYLMKKWQNADHPEMSVSSTVPSVTYADGLEPVVGSDRDITIGTVTSSSGGTFTKKGTGAVMIDTGFPPEQFDSLVVEGGTLDMSVSISNILARATLHLDANVGVTYTNDLGGVSYMTNWTDVRGASYGHATPVVSMPNGTNTLVLPSGPVVKTVTIAGREQKVVDCGAVSRSSEATSNGNVYPNSTTAAIKFWDSDNERKRLFAEYYVVHADNGYNSNRNGVIGQHNYFKNTYLDNGTERINTYPFYRSVSSKQITTTSQGYDVYHGEIFVDDANTPTNGSYKIENADEFHLFSFTPRRPVVSGGLAIRESYEVGGTQTGEFLCFAKTNSVVERALIRAHLYSKWFGDGSEPATSPSLGAFAVHNGGTLRIACDDTVADFSVASISGNGTIDINRAIGGVTSFDIGDEAGETGTMTTTGNLDISSISQLTLNFVSRTEYDSLTVGGTLVLPAACNVNIDTPNDLKGLDGVYTVISGAPISGNIAGWTITRSPTVNGIAILVKTGNEVQLRIVPTGSIIIMR